MPARPPRSAACPGRTPLGPATETSRHSSRRSFQNVVQTWLSNPMTNRSRLPGARETAAICCLSRSNTAWPGNGNQSPFQPPLVPECGPDVVVEPNDEQIEVAWCPRDRRDLLLVAVEYRLARQRKPVAIPAAACVPKCGPDVVVEPNDEQIEVAWCPRDRRDLLLVAVEHRLAGQREPVTVPAGPRVKSMPSRSSCCSARRVKLGLTVGNITEPATVVCARPSRCPISCSVTVSISNPFATAPSTHICSWSSKCSGKGRLSTITEQPGGKSEWASTPPTML